MKAQHEDLNVLLHIQEIDREIHGKTKEFDELPQRQAIVELREKKDAFVAKQKQVLTLKRDVAHKLSRNRDEDASLAKKEAGVQAAIEAAHGDFRHAEARTKELAGIAKRREKLSEDQAEFSAELSKIEDLEARISLAVEDLEAKEAKTVEEFKEQGGRLRNDLARLEQQRAQKASEAPADLVELYTKTAERSGGVGIGLLEDDRCGVCRSRIEGGRLIDLKAQAPLGTCPHCRRLLIIQ